jgi:hypothetical protein
MYLLKFFIERLNHNVLIQNMTHTQATQFYKGDIHDMTLYLITAIRFPLGGSDR